MNAAGAHIFISAGEASGDMHAGQVIRALFRICPDARISGITGPAMRDAGCETLLDMNELNVMGVVDVLKSLPRIHRVRKQVLQQLADEAPDVAILVDYPGFHINIGRRMRQTGIPVLQYIAPKLWAWGAWRARKLRDSQDALAGILPFEPAWFADRGITAHYVGNPSAVACVGGWSREEFMQRAGLEATAPVLAILPGSRPSELAHHVPLLSRAWERIQRSRPDVQAVIPLAPGVDEAALHPLTRRGVRLIPRRQQGFHLYADAAVAVSGTATLELALWGVPTVLVYCTAPLTVFMARRVLRIPYIGLANLLLQQAAMPELIQDQATEESIAGELLTLLDDRQAADAQRHQFDRLRALLGDDDPAEKVARMAVSLAGLRD